MIRRVALLAAAVLALAGPALAQGWKAYDFPADGFQVQLPAPFTSARTTYRTGSGSEVPATSYTLTQPDAIYSISVADLRGTNVSEQAALDEAAKPYRAGNQVKDEVVERIDRHFGPQLTLVGKDGARLWVSIFYVEGRLYRLEGRALPPDPSVGAAKAVRYVQSLSFIGIGDEALRPENRGGFGPPPRGFPRR